MLRVTCLGRTIFEFAPYTTRRAEYLPEAIHTLNADIICFQEVFGEDHFVALRHSLHGTHPHAVRFASRKGHLLGNGLAILSRLTILDKELIVFRSQTVDERLLSPRAMICARIEFPGIGIIALYNIHTTAGGVFRHPEKERVEDIRAQQLAEILARLAKEKETIPLLAGDFNCGPEASRPNYAALLAAGLVDVATYLEGGGDILPWVTWDPENPLNRSGPHRTSPPQRIDHVFLLRRDLNRLCPIWAHPTLTAPLVDVEGGKVTVSDHVGFMAGFALPPP